MKTIIVRDYINSAVSKESALIIRNKIEEYLPKEDKLILDFSKITKFTALFFNFSTGYMISFLGLKGYDSRIYLINLSELGESVYKNSYRNSVEKYSYNKN